MLRATKQTFCEALAQAFSFETTTKPKTDRKQKAAEDLSTHPATKHARKYQQSHNGRADELRKAADNDR
jgi:hypothetical protein